MVVEKALYNDFSIFPFAEKVVCTSGTRNSEVRLNAISMQHCKGFLYSKDKDFELSYVVVVIQFLSGFALLRAVGPIHPIPSAVLRTPSRHIT